MCDVRPKSKSISPLSTLPIFSLDDRVAVVTGGSRGIGFEIARAMRDSGAHLILADRLRDEGHAAAAELGAEFVETDVTRSESVRALAAGIAARHGRIDILANIAGIALNTPSEDTTDEDWRRVMSVNLDGVFFCCREVGRHMLARGKGVIVNMASMSGLVSNHPQPQAAYNASKAGIHHLARSLAGEWATYGIRVNAVAPGYVDTDMSNVTVQDPYYGDRWMEGTPMRRMLRPEEVASVNLFLATEASSGMTGSIVVVDGGYTIW